MSEHRDLGMELDRLRARFGQVEVREERVENGPGRSVHAVDLADEGWLGDAGTFVVDPDAGRRRGDPRGAVVDPTR